MEGDWNASSLLGCAILGILYCRYVVLGFQKGFRRVMAATPVICMYLYLPWKSSCIHVRGMFAFMFMWISSFKILMLCYDVGPLASPWATTSLLHFVAMAALPIKARHPKISGSKPLKPKSTKSEPLTLKPRFSLLKMSTEICLLMAIVCGYSLRNRLPWTVVLLMYGLHIYLFLDLSFVSLATVVDWWLGADLEPQFKKPYLARSLEEFWGSRWNLIVTNILRPSVYDPVLGLCWRTHKAFCKKKGIAGDHMRPPVWARAAAVMATFVVSGLMHELILYYLAEARVTWDVMGFFVLHGLCTVIEILLKRAQLSPEMVFPYPVSVFLTLGFIYVTAVWLFFPKFTKTGVDSKGIAEYEYVADKMCRLFTWLGGFPLKFRKGVGEVSNTQ